MHTSGVVDLIPGQGTKGPPGDSDGKESACNAGDLCLIPGLGRSSGEGNGNMLQYSGLENSMDCPWVAKSRTRLSNFQFFFLIIPMKYVNPLLNVQAIVFSLYNLY